MHAHTPALHTRSPCAGSAVARVLSSCTSHRCRTRTGRKTDTQKTTWWKNAQQERQATFIRTKTEANKFVSKYTNVRDWVSDAGDTPAQTEEAYWAVCDALRILGRSFRKTCMRAILEGARERLGVKLAAIRAGAGAGSSGKGLCSSADIVAARGGWGGVDCERLGGARGHRQHGEGSATKQAAPNAVEGNSARRQLSKAEMDLFQKTIGAATKPRHRQPPVKRKAPRASPLAGGATSAAEGAVGAIKIPRCPPLQNEKGAG